MIPEKLGHCLDKMNEEFNTEQFTSCLKQNNPQEKITSKYSHQALKSLETKNLIIKIGKASYKKILPTDVDSLYIINEFSKKCRQEKKVSYWEYGGLLSTSAQFIFLGVTQSNSIPEWKSKYLNILLSRSADIYKAIQLLMTYDYKGPVLDSESSRQVCLELIPYWLGHQAGDDHNGLNVYDLLEEIGDLTKNIQHDNGKNDVEEIFGLLRKSQEDKSIQYHIPKKIAEKLVMINFPNDWTLDDRYDERKLVKYLTTAIKLGLSVELIMYELANFWRPEIVDKTLVHLEYLSINKIRTIRNYFYEFLQGRIILPYLDDIDYCSKIIDGLENGELKRGWYGKKDFVESTDEDEMIVNRRLDWDKPSERNFTYLGTKKPENAEYLIDYECKSKKAGRIRHGSSTYFRIRSKSYYEKILESRISSLRQLVKGTEIDKAVKAAGFTLSYKLPKDSSYLREGFEISKGLTKYGIGIDEEQIQLSFNKGKKQGEQFVKKALKSRGRLTINS